jgi:hypothetical protein
MEHFYFLIAFLLFCLIVLFKYLKTGKLKYRFKFSVRNYYLLVSVFLIGVVAKSLHDRSWFLPVLFLILCVMGVVGETLFSVWWRVFYKKNFWVYKVETLAHAYTSLLNFLPWGVGGALLVSFAEWLVPLLPPHFKTYHVVSLGVPFWQIFILFLFLGSGIQLSIWIIFTGHVGRNFKFKKATFWNYLFFISPFLLSLAACCLIFSWSFLLIAAVFAAVGGSAEYLFGKATQFFISKKLWSYSYCSFDNGHFTPLALAGFSIAGFLSWATAYALHSFLKY